MAKTMKLSREALKTLGADPKDKICAGDSSIQEVIQRFKAAKKRVLLAEMGVETHGMAIRKYMGKATLLVDPVLFGLLATNRPCTSYVLNEKRLKKERPDIYKKYLKKRVVKRLLVK